MIVAPLIERMRNGGWFRRGDSDPFERIPTMSRFDNNRGAIPMTTAHQVLNCLNHEKIRATYGAVGKVIGLPAQSVWRKLGPHSLRASWVVNKRNGEPIDYSPDDKHPDLHRTDHVITTGQELAQLLESSQR